MMSELSPLVNGGIAGSVSMQSGVRFTDKGSKLAIFYDGSLFNSVLLHNFEF